jgi:hypothetical protein
MGNDAPSQMPGWVMPVGALVLLLILLCCSSLVMSYSRVGNINIFSSSKEFTPEELAYAQAHGGAMPPGSSSDAGSSGLGLLDAFGVKQKCKVGPWSDWSACDANCGTTAHRTRTRQVVTPAKNGGSCTDPLTESDLCTSLPACEVPALNGQYEPCTDGASLTGASCIVTGTHPPADECERLKNQAVNQAAGEGAMYGAAGAGIGAAYGAAIGAAVASSNFDCSTFYYCPTGFRDTHINQQCDKAAVPKCPTGGYTWNATRGMCMMGAAPAPSPH